MTRNRLASVFVAAFASFALGASCDPEPDPPPEDVTIQPLPQESIILVEAELNETWVTLPVPQDGAERLARTLCYEDRRMTDMKVCEDEDAGLITTDWEDTSLPGNSQEECQRTLCRARNQVCAGYLLEEMGRSPLPRTLVAAELLGRPFDIADDLLVDTARCSTAMAKANLPEDCAGRTASRLRFKPQQAPGRAAALRGAMNRYREAGIVTRKVIGLGKN